MSKNKKITKEEWQEILKDISKLGYTVIKETEEDDDVKQIRVTSMPTIKGK